MAVISFLKLAGAPCEAVFRIVGTVPQTQKNLAMSESLTDRTEPRSWRGAGEARFGAKSLMQDNGFKTCKANQ